MHMLNVYLHYKFYVNIMNHNNAYNFIKHKANNTKVISQFLYNSPLYGPLYMVDGDALNTCFIV